RRRMSRGERRVAREGYERLRLRVAEWGPGPVDERLQRGRCPVGKRNRDDRQDERAPAPLDRSERERQNDPQKAEAPGVREPFEEWIQPARAMVDDPALEVAIGGDQAGTICFVWSINARRSKGLPTKAWAPRCAASAPASSCPLNITTGIEPTPCRSCTRRSISQPSTCGIITS